MKYKVHVAYIKTDGGVVASGIYEESELDLAEARSKSVVTLIDSSVEAKKESLTPYFKEFNLESIARDVAEIKLNSEQSKITLTSLKINFCTEEELKQVKYVGKSKAEKVLKEREIREFVSYIDLDERVPLAFSKKWQDVVLLDFTPKTKNSPILLEFI